MTHDLSPQREQARTWTIPICETCGGLAESHVMLDVDPESNYCECETGQTVRFVEVTDSAALTELVEAATGVLNRSAAPRRPGQEAIERLRDALSAFQSFSTPTTDQAGRADR